MGRKNEKYLSELQRDLGLKTASGLQRDLDRYVDRRLVTRRKHSFPDGHPRVYYILTKEGRSHAASIQIREMMGLWFELGTLRFALKRKRRKNKTKKANPNSGLRRRRVPN
jgi:DNA-binding HxlR family transcriptional regulator